MSARPRDLTKTRTRRILDVVQQAALKAGGANTQIVLDGCALAVGGTPTQLAVVAGEVFIGGALTPIAAIPLTPLPAGAATAAGQVRKVAVDVNALGVVVLTVGALSPDGTQASAVLPQTPVDSITIGWIEIPASFVVGTTNLTGAMLKPMPYDSGVAQ